MKKIHLLLLKAFIRPFIVTFMIVMFVLLMLFLFKYIDDLIGKGFELTTILQLMLYASATNVAMALPLSVLLSSIMTYGSLGENYELVAIKSAGVSLRRAMYPMIIVVGILSIAAFIFSDNMLPVANRKYYSLLYDVRQQKSANLLPEGVFSNSFPGYSIRVNKKDPDGQTLHDVMIYSKNESDNNTNVLVAKEGRMYRTMDNQFLILRLKDGVRYEEAHGDKNFEMRQRFTRFRFKETEQKFDLSFMKLKRTDENLFRQAVQMMDLKQLKYFGDSTRRQLDSVTGLNYKQVSPYIKYFGIPKKPKDAKIKYVVCKSKNILGDMSLQQQVAALMNAQNEVRSVTEVTKNRADMYKDMAKSGRNIALEYQKKFELSAACITLFLIGAPMGSIIRKGGLGMPVVVSVIFFLVYYITWTIGEKSAKGGDLSPVIGEWISIIILTPIGLFLSYKAANDSVLFDMEAYKRFFNKLLRRKDV
ncbi:LptF/LptG family permease [Mucilaginibacter sp. BT774]|uniref:LptF/LptG family permease n=1 Tax=Mucilaginibacter sp. BT774 TaxID=3062276 RepID=UPI0026754279|nr:LptF/LptG family permease [Mucilaginibacter sp. BT774]MDO3628254.1 LptF/LptG family permease [Mucilaginibacter sp. BT774]